MSEYKVPQNVEAEDKLIGPFGFRQFVYLLICAALIGIVIWVGSAVIEVGIVLGVIFLPVVLFLVILALPLRQDQPMETYVAALIRYHLYPRLKIWDSDGTDGTVEITVPKSEEELRTKNISGEEAASKLSFLSNVVDTGGNSMRDDVYNAAVATTDMLDFDTAMTSKVNRMLEEKEAERQEEIRNVMQASARMNQAQSMKRAVAGVEARAERAEAELAELKAKQAQATAPEIKLDSEGGLSDGMANEVETVHPVVEEDVKEVSVAADNASAKTEEPAIIDPEIARLAFDGHKSVETVAKEANEVYVKLR